MWIFVKGSPRHGAFQIFAFSPSTASINGKPRKTLPAKIALVLPTTTAQLTTEAAPARWGERGRHPAMQEIDISWWIIVFLVSVGLNVRIGLIDIEWPLSKPWCDGHAHQHYSYHQHNKHTLSSGGLLASTTPTHNYLSSKFKFHLSSSTPPPSNQLDPSVGSPNLCTTFLG